MRHLLDTTDLTVEEIDELIALAMDIIADKQKYAHICDGKSLQHFSLSQAQEHAFPLRRQ